MGLNINKDLKFNIGDTAYIIFDNKVTQVEISHIIIDINRYMSFGLKYICYPGTEQKTLNESQLYETKEELLNSL